MAEVTLERSLSIKMLKMKDDPAICMTTKVDGKNDGRKSGHNCISEQKLADILDVLRAKRDSYATLRSGSALEKVSGMPRCFRKERDLAFER